MKCPVCGREKVKEVRQCPKLNGTVLCERCCKKCEYRGLDANPCLFYVNSPRAKMIQELSEKIKHAEFLKKTADRLWKRNMNYAASQKEAEWRFAIQQIRELEEELNEGNKSACTADYSGGDSGNFYRNE